MKVRSGIADADQPAAANTGLRERQKTRRRADILAAGQQLFMQQGYAATNMESVAELAEVGVATVYNYFGTKGRLLADILRSDFNQLFEQGEDLIRQLPDKPAEAVLQLIAIYQTFQDNWQHRNLLVAVIGPGLSAEPALDDLSSHAEHRVKQQLIAMLSAYQDAGKLRPDIDIEDAALIIFYIFNQHFIQFVAQQSMDFTVMKANMDRQIKFIVQAIHM